ncbi:TPA: hypothetical protein QH882_003833 [Klebsiella variicola]|nr:hypothetical protein [Klebsiella variicola]HDU5029982.1 hypothetical protein [Klebsiella variicola]
MEFSDNQVNMLKKVSAENYISEIIEHCEIMFPLLIPLQKKDDFRSCIQQSIVFAKKAGYTQRGPVRLYIDMMIILGSDFGREPLFQSLKIKYQKDLPQIERSLSLYTLLNDYIAKVYGEDGCFFKKSFEIFKGFSAEDFTVKISSSNAGLHELLRGVYPQRYDFAGYNAVNDLIAVLDEACETYKVKRLYHRLYLALIMLLFGCSFEQDIFRGHLITEPLMKYFNNDDISGQNIIVSSYASFQVNHG